MEFSQLGCTPWGLTCCCAAVWGESVGGEVLRAASGRGAGWWRGLAWHFGRVVGSGVEILRAVLGRRGGGLAVAWQGLVRGVGVVWRIGGVLRAVERRDGEMAVVAFVLCWGCGVLCAVLGWSGGAGSCEPSQDGMLGQGRAEVARVHEDLQRFRAVGVVHLRGGD
ncbi:hypothetical protein EDB85DRAFT_1887191 [Lactarius pseudohatsudake]|nr:hypothetical protein EDB85DRAFT_1887191 [Lactarius pseudohatsudake]